MLADGEPELDGVSAKLVGTVVREDGAKQITLGGWPLYRYIGDPKPGAWKGQMVSGTWFVRPRRQEEHHLPADHAKPVQPPSDEDEEEEESGGDGY